MNATVGTEPASKKPEDAKSRLPYAIAGDAKVVDKNSVTEPNIFRPKLGRVVLASGLFLWSVFLPIVYYSTYQILSWGEPGWVVVAIVIFEFLLGNVVWRVLVYSSLNYGVVLGEKGIIYYQRSTSRKKLIKRFFEWNDLHDPVIGVTQVILRANHFPMELSYDQARELFIDERCPLKARPSIEMARKLGV